MVDVSAPPATEGLDWRVPQEFVPASSYEVRDVVQDYVVRDLLGPWDGAHESWHPVTHPGTPRDPLDRYLVGMLGPKKVDQVEEESTDLELGATVSHETDLPEAVNPRTLGKLWVSSMGLSFQVAAAPDGPDRLVVEVDAARYVPGAAELTDAGKTVHPVTRQPLHWSVELDLSRRDATLGLADPTADGPGAASGTVSERADPDGLALRCQVRDHHGRRVVRLTLVNDQPAEVTPKYRNWLFQAALTVTALDGAEPVFLPGGDSSAVHRDPEEAHLALLYAHDPPFATGHNVAACVDRHPGELRAWRLRTSWVPVVDVPAVTAQPVAGLQTSMARLAALADRADPSELVQSLRPLVSGYGRWLDGRDTDAAALAAPWPQIGNGAVSRARQAERRLEAALALLASSAPARRCFAFANRAMEQQRLNSVVALRREHDPTLGYAEALAQVSAGAGAVEHASWRPFQLAFVLLNLPALTDPDSSERTDDVDLLFFPTGGGKTEAYLGLAAYTFAIRRLQGVIGSGPQARDGRAGVAVLMRYTLRLLTAQQFQRAAALVCAAEVLRREDPATWGDERFSIGLWVGMSVSPNWYADAATSIANARESGRRGQPVPVLQTTQCPWCAEPLQGERDLHADDVTRRVRVYCPRGEGPSTSPGNGGTGSGNGGSGPCPFSRRESPDGLPIMTVDEEVYREPPSLLIATVDKLAQLPWYGFAGLLFGRVSARCPRHGYRHLDLDQRIGCGGRHAATGPYPAVTSQPVTRLRPPDLVIQDELHLISGALGSTVGLFEGAVEELTTWTTPSGGRCTPKIVASTATTKRAAEQVRQLFARNLSVFPPQVLDSRRTYFSDEQPVTPVSPGRRYLGLCAHGTRLKAAEIRLAEILLLAGQAALDTYGSAADPYATLVGYFNSTRELAGMRRYLDDQVVTRMRRPWRPGLPARATADLKITELTSRISSGYIADALRQLTVPFDPETGTSARRTAIRAVIKQLAGRRPDDLRDERATDVALATSMLQVGVDVGRLGLMVITGQPKNVAEYIQASSRVGRERDRPGLVIALYNWTRPRDLAYYESFEHSHATLYRQVEALSVTPFARRCLDRGTAGTLIAAVRNATEEWSTDVAAQTVPLGSAAVAALRTRMLDRARRAAGEQAEDYLAAALDRVLSRWGNEQALPAAPTGYTKVRRQLVDYRPLMKRAGEGAWNDLTVARSMRETENDISLLLPPSPQIFEASASAPAWSAFGSNTPPGDGSAS
ncbi:DISARM system helicase DrmA [uncultured Friedmanniella sp.]|uniref:DISARM system helicase DrmA n=1 Tax=uncultured Friedmanniella sp. TaxID=335381 RepID=UPI0035CBA874